MENAPLISFIITAYNIPAELLIPCIKSVLDLSLGAHEREIIVVDDGSQTPAIDAISSFANDIIYIRQRNQGLSVARNTGLTMASGKYIQFVDGDDMLIRVPYEHCLDIARYHNPDMVLFSETTASSAETPFTYDGPITGSNYMRDNNLHASACGYIFEKRMAGQLKFTPGILHEDEEFTPQLFLRSERLYTTDAKAYYYRKREGSIINANNSEHTKRRLADMEQVLFHLQRLVVPESDVPAINRRIAQLTMDYLYNVIKLTHSRRTLNETINRLSDSGLFPLPDKDYTAKYKYFRKMINNKYTRQLLFLAIKR
jgi:glycosyltransferase involved in cell wall biosynthesis